MQPKLDRIDPVKTGTSASAIQDRSDTYSDRQKIYPDGMPGWHMRPPTQRQLVPAQITHSISSSHLQLDSLSRRVIVVQRMRCNWALITCRLASQQYVGLATFDVTTRRTCSASCKRINALIKVDRAVEDCGDLSLPLHFCLLVSNRHLLFGFFFQITGVCNSNPGFELFDRIPDFWTEHCIPNIDALAESGTWNMSIIWRWHSVLCNI